MHLLGENESDSFKHSFFPGFVHQIMFFERSLGMFSKVVKCQSRLVRGLHSNRLRLGGLYDQLCHYLLSALSGVREVKFVCIDTVPISLPVFFVISWPQFSTSSRHRSFE